VCRRTLSAAILLAMLAMGSIPAARGQADLPGPPPPFPAPDQPAPLPEIPPPAEPARVPPSLPAPAPRPAGPPAFRLLHPPHGPELAPILPATVKQVKAEAQGMLLPALRVEKRGPASVQAGQPAVYEIIVRNVGSAPAAGLRVEDDLPAGARLLETTPEAAVQGTHLTWSLETLGVGQESRYRVNLLPAAGGELISRAAVSLPLAAAAAQTRVLAPSLSLRVQAPDSAIIGQKVDLKIRLLSVDGQPIRGVKLQIRLPEGLQHEAGRVIETDPFDIQGEAVKDIALHVRAVQPGRQLLEAVATTSGQQVRDGAEVVVAEASAARRPGTGLAIRKKGTSRPVLGEKYDYELWVENRSQSAISNVCLYDRIPEGLTFKAAGQDGNYEETTRTVQWRLGTLQPGQRRIVTLRLQARLVGEQSNPVWATGEPGQEAHLTASMQVDSRAAAVTRKNK
jgi:uncharacterized repeat protein (TIGR01451 family)